MPEGIRLGSTSAALQEILDEAERGWIQVPEFQRPFMLRHAWVKSLLASVSLGYPVGAIMLLEAGDTGHRFRSRPVGETAADSAPRWFLIDGQQRVTALYRVLGVEGGTVVEGESGEPERRRFFVDIEVALEPGRDRDEAILSVAGDAAGPAGDAAQGLFPLGLALDRVASARWLRGFIDAPGADRTARERLARRFEEEVLEAVQTYRLPTIVLPKETTRWSVRVHGGREGPALSDQFRVSAT